MATWYGLTLASAAVLRRVVSRGTTIRINGNWTCDGSVPDATGTFTTGGTSVTRGKHDVVLPPPDAHHTKVLLPLQGRAPIEWTQVSAPATERNQKIVAYALANPCATLEQIGGYHGISRERVRQIIELAGAHKPDALQARVAARPVRLCTECGLPMGGKVATHHQRCAPKVELPCAVCGVTFLRPLYWFKSRAKTRPDYTLERFYCSHACRNADKDFHREVGGRRKVK